MQKGYQLNLGEGLSGTFKLDYLELTALAKPTFPLGESEDEGPSFHLLAGPAVGIRTSCSDQGQGEIDDCADDVTESDPGIPVGAGIQTGRFRVDATYTLGVTDIDATGSGDEIDSIENRSMAIQAGFVIPLGSGS